MSAGIYDIDKILGLAGLSNQPAESTVAKVKDDYFKTDPGSQKDPSPQQATATMLLGAKLKVDVTGRSGVGGSIFFRRKSGTHLSGSLGVVDFDLILDEETTYRAQVCQHPVQSGDPITDHIQALPPTGRLKVLVSNYSLKVAYGGVKEGQWDESVNRALEAYETLKRLMRSRSEVALVTTLEDFSAMNNYVVLTRLTTPKKADDGDSLTFDIEYTQIYKVSRLKTTSLPVSIRVSDMASAKNRTAGPETSTGSQSPQPEAMPDSGVLPTGGE
jgi:hypothetical protein